MRDTQEIMVGRGFRLSMADKNYIGGPKDRLTISVLLSYVQDNFSDVVSSLWHSAFQICKSVFKRTTIQHTKVWFLWSWNARVLPVVFGRCRGPAVNFGRYYCRDLWHQGRGQYSEAPLNHHLASVIRPDRTGPNPNPPPFPPQVS